MKKIFKRLILPLLLLSVFVTKVSAAGTVSASLTGSQTVTKGSSISVNVYVGTVSGTSGDGKVYAFQGTINYDPTYLEYQSISGASNWTPTYNATSKKFILGNYGLDSGIKNGTVGTIKFKAIKSGTTSVSVTGAAASDTAGDLTVSMGGAREITINDPTPVTPKSNNSRLSALAVEGQTLTPTFSADVTSYTVTVPEETEAVNITATVEDTGKATLTGTGSKTLSGKLTTATIKVTAEDGTSTNYVVNIIREAKQVTPEPEPEKEPEVVKSNDSTLKKLDVSGYTLTPAFSSGVTSYAMKVTNNITALNVTAIPNDEKAKVSISGNKNWVEGNNAILVKVTAEDGTSTIYTVNVNRAAANTKSSDTNVDLRIISSHSINPEYSNSLNEFYVTVPNDVTKLDLTVTPYDKKTKVTINNNDKELEVGVLTPVTISVVAEDGTSRTITLYVTRSEEKANTDLLDLRVVGHTMNPQFKPSITSYDVNVKYDEDELEIIAKAAEGSTVEISGNENLKVGKNKILVKVTDENGYIKYYEINATKEGKKSTSFFGIGLIPFLILLGLLLLLLILLLILLFKRRKEDEVEVKQQDAPVNIDFKPEFNFNSKNGTDDDVVYSEGSMINGTDVQKLPNLGGDDVPEAKYDIYDDVVTKDELVDAINESIETKNPEKLKMLLEQEKLNRKKEELKKKDKVKALKDKENE